MDFVKKILENNPAARTDGNGSFLNIVADQLFGDSVIDFNKFNVESYTRARRKVMELYPHLDGRTNNTKEAEETVKEEMR